MSLWERVAALNNKTSRWGYKVIDSDLVPEEYKACDPKKIHLAIAKGIREVPGLEIYEVE